MPNAPAFGSEVWSTLAQRGLDDLYTTAVAGLPTGMPAKGGCMDCSEDELKNTIQYMLDSAK